MGDKFDPLLPKWNKTKTQSDALKNGKLKPDIVPAIKQYDKAGTDWDTLQEEKKNPPSHGPLSICPTESSQPS